MARYSWTMSSNTDRYAFLPGAAQYPTIVAGDGVFLIADDGRRILDAAGGAIVGNIGWGRTEVAAATAAVMSMGYVVPLWPTPSRLALRDELVQHWLPEGFNHVFFTSGGSESTDSAIRLARAYQVAKGRDSRWKVLGRHPSYHGMTTGTMAVASHSARQKGYEPLLLPFPKVPWDDAEQVLKVIEQEDPATIAGFIVEPITGAAGACLTASDEYWQVVTDACREHDILLIADEVMTGYGRTGLNFGHQHFPLVPDVIVGGKGLGGGYVPLGAVAATRSSTRCAARGSCTSRSRATTARVPPAPRCSRSCAASTSSNVRPARGHTWGNACATSSANTQRWPTSADAACSTGSSCTAAATPWCRPRWSATCGCTRPARAPWPTQ